METRSFAVETRRRAKAPGERVGGNSSHARQSPGKNRRKTSNRLGEILHQKDEYEDAKAQVEKEIEIANEELIT